MKKYLLIILMVFASSLLFAQRYNIPPGEGKTGFMIAGMLFALVLLITVVLYFKKRKK